MIALSRKAVAFFRLVGWSASAIVFAGRRILFPAKPLAIFSPSLGGAGSAADLRAWAISKSMHKHRWDTFVFHPRVGLKMRRLCVKVFRADIIVFQQTRLAFNRPEFFAPLPCVLDVDDADIINKSDEARIGDIARRCKAVIAGSRYIANLFAPWNDHVNVVWTGTYLREAVGAAAPATRSRIIAWAPSDPFGYPDEVAFVKNIIDLIPAGRIDQFRIYGVAKHRQPDMVAMMRWEEAPVFVRFMPGMPYEEFVSSLAEAAVGLQPVCATHEYSLGKSFGKTLAYLVADVAVVASDNVDHPLFFHDRLNGRLLSNHAEVWRDACLELLDSPVKLQEIVRQARKDFMLRLTTDKAAALVSAVLTDTLALESSRKAAALPGIAG